MLNKKSTNPTSDRSSRRRSTKQLALFAGVAAVAAPAGAMAAAAPADATLAWTQWYTGCTSPGVHPTPWDPYLLYTHSGGAEAYAFSSCGYHVSKGWISAGFNANGLGWAGTGVNLGSTSIIARNFGSRQMLSYTCFHAGRNAHKHIMGCDGGYYEP